MEIVKDLNLDIKKINLRFPLYLLLTMNGPNGLYTAKTELLCYGHDGSAFWCLRHVDGEEGWSWIQNLWSTTRLLLKRYLKTGMILMSNPVNMWPPWCNQCLFTNMISSEKKNPIQSLFTEADEMVKMSQKGIGMANCHHAYSNQSMAPRTSV